MEPVDPKRVSGVNYRILSPQGRRRTSVASFALLTCALAVRLRIHGK